MNEQSDQRAFVSDGTRHCERCCGLTHAWTCSYFDDARICLRCCDVESDHPEYDRARRAKTDRARGGDFGYRGVGLPPDLEALCEDARGDAP